MSTFSRAEARIQIWSALKATCSLKKSSMPWRSRTYSLLKSPAMMWVAMLEEPWSRWSECWSSATPRPRRATRPPEEAFRAEFGYALTELGSVAGAVANLALEAGGAVMSKPRAEVVTHPAAVVSIDEPSVDRILRDLTLGLRPDFLQPGGFRQEDVYPWRFNRRLSVIRRPILLRLRADEVDELVWGTRTQQGVAQLVQLLHDGRLEAGSPEMQDLKSKLADAKGAAFVDEVRRRIVGLGFRVETNVTKVGSLGLVGDGRNLGDIDVLAADVAQRVIWAIECKSLGVARTPGSCGARSASSRHQATASSSSTSDERTGSAATWTTSSVG